MTKSPNLGNTKYLPIGIKPNGSPYTVFLIDDSNTAREILKRTLLSLKFKVIDEANNGEIALKRLEQSKTEPDFIFIDMEMPLMDGMETIKRLKPFLPDSKIIMVTSHGERDMVIDLLKLGVQGFIKKPYDRDTVMKKMASILGRPVED
jgi:two-component system chemotaxis response regulator CheY